MQDVNKTMGLSVKEKDDQVKRKNAEILRLVSDLDKTKN